MEFLANNPLVTLLIIVWTLPWKGVALWRAAKRGEQRWFIALLVLNTLAILDIIYIFYFSEREEQRDPKASFESPELDKESEADIFQK